MILTCYIHRVNLWQARVVAVQTFCDSCGSKCINWSLAISNSIALKDSYFTTSLAKARLPWHKYSDTSPPVTKEDSVFYMCVFPVKTMNLLSMATNPQSGMSSMTNKIPCMPCWLYWGLHCVAEDTQPQWRILWQQVP